MPLDSTKIRKRRERLKLTQGEAADRAKMPQPHWARLESGEREDPALTTAERVAAALRTHLSKILRK